MREIDAVLCDLDGTLVDSEMLHLDAWVEVLPKEGLAMAKALMEDLIGKPDSYMRDKFVEAFPQLADKGILEEKQNRYREMVRTKGGKMAYPGVADALKRLLDAGVKIAVGTNSILENTLFSLEMAGLRRYFEAVVTMEMVDNAKPAPDIYIEAARRVGVEPGRCCVIEDSSTGLQAGKNAGCRTLGVTNSWPAEMLTAADRVFTSTPAAMDWALSRAR